MEQMQVTVPPGVMEGMLFQVNTPAGPMQVACPEGVSGGQQMIVNVPAQQQAGVIMGTAAPAPMPMIMATPVQTQAAPVVMAAAPQPMQMSIAAAAAGRGAELSFSLDLGKRQKLEEARIAGAPPALAAKGMTNSEWDQVVNYLITVMDTNPFANCETCECCYWCVPLGPIQTALCMCNPCTFCLYGGFETAKTTAKAQLAPMLTNYQYTVEFVSGMEDVAVIKPVYG